MTSSMVLELGIEGVRSGDPTSIIYTRNTGILSSCKERNLWHFITFFEFSPSRKAMENTGLLNTPYSDNESNADSDINSSKVITSQRCSKSQQRLAICRVVLDLLVLLLLGILIILVAGRYNTVKNRCIQHHLPVGSDLSGFVPAGIISFSTLEKKREAHYFGPRRQFPPNFTSFRS